MFRERGLQTRQRSGGKTPGVRRGRDDSHGKRTVLRRHRNLGTVKHSRLEDNAHIAVSMRQAWSYDDLLRDGLDDLLDGLDYDLGAGRRRGDCGDFGRDGRSRRRGWLHGDRRRLNRRGGTDIHVVCTFLNRGNPCRRRRFGDGGLLGNWLPGGNLRFDGNGFLCGNRLSSNAWPFGHDWLLGDRRLLYDDLLFCCDMFPCGNRHFRDCRFFGNDRLLCDDRFFGYNRLSCDNWFLNDNRFF